MRNLGDTIGRISARRAAFAMPGMAANQDRLLDFSGFGSNPGGLTARVFVPAGLPEGAPLVVVLHGCTQTAADYDAGSGWSALAEEAGFAVLFAEQVRGNNPNLCFNWFVPGDIAAGGGEVASIGQMIAAVLRVHGLDRTRVFVTGLSAGGAMAMAMLATSPQVFAGGAIIAGLPYGAARTMPEAFDRMRGQGLPDAAAAAALVRDAAGDVARWPVLSVWHGDADATVDVANARAITAGWARLHGAVPAVGETVGGHRRRVWRDAAGREVIEAFEIAGMGHGTPLGDGLGTAGPYMLEVGISSTRRIAAFWGIAPAVVAGDRAAAPAGVRPPAAANGGGVGGVIEAALRSAGLMR